jgi:hypothetical protein
MEIPWCGRNKRTIVWRQNQSKFYRYFVVRTPSGSFRADVYGEKTIDKEVSLLVSLWRFPTILGDSPKLVHQVQTTTPQKDLFRSILSQLQDLGEHVYTPMQLLQLSLSA